MRVTAEKTLAFPVLLLVWLAGYKFTETELMPVVLVLMILVLVRLAVLYKNVQTILIFCIFHLTFILILIPYFFYEIPISPHTELQIDEYMNSTLLIHSAFVMALYIFTDLQIPRRKVVLAQYLPKRESPLSYYLLVGIMIVIIVSMFWNKRNVYSDPGNIWDTYLGNMEGASGAAEYFCVVFLVAFVFASNRLKRYGLVGLFILYSYVAISRALRASAILMCLLFFALFLDGKVKTRYILTLTFIAVFIVHGAGTVREGRTELSDILNPSSRSGQLVTNQGETFYTSNMVVSTIIDGAVGPKERLTSLFGALLQTVIPPTIAFSNEGRPSIYTWKLTGREAGGGCLASVFFYFWLDYLGVILAALYIAWVTRRAIKHPTPLLSVYIVGVFSFYPRWLVYDAVNFLFRVPFYGILLYVCTVECHKMILKSKLTRENPIPQ